MGGTRRILRRGCRQAVSVRRRSSAGSVGGICAASTPAISTGQNLAGSTACLSRARIDRRNPMKHPKQPEASMKPTRRTDCARHERREWTSWRCWRIRSHAGAVPVGWRPARNRCADFCGGQVRKVSQALGRLRRFCKIGAEPGREGTTSMWWFFAAATLTPHR